MKSISATMNHNADTITLLSVTQYNTFFFWKKLLQLACGIALLLLGITRPADNVWGIVCLFFGCWILTSLDMPAKFRANRILEAMNGVFPSSTYEFYSDHFVLTANEIPEKIDYSSLIRLVENNQYLFLYISPYSAYMVDSRTITAGKDTLKILLSDAAKLKWKKPNRLLTFSRKSLFLHQKKH